MMSDELDEAKVWEAFGLMMQMYEDKVFSDTDRQQVTEAGLRDFRALLKRRLLERENGLPTVDEVDGLKILALDFFNYTPNRPPSRYGGGQF
jgi:hypothetical protein